MKLNPYFDFDGNAEEAVLFYASVFDVKPDLMRYGDAPDHDPKLAQDPVMKNRILHAHLLVDGVSLMFSDVPPGLSVSTGTRITLNLTLTDRTKLERWYQRLSEGAITVTPLAETFWTPAFGYLVDRFGIPWMVNLETPSEGHS
jgi:PhnB protein